MNPGHLAPGSLFLAQCYPELESLRLVGEWGGDPSRIQGPGAGGQGNECSPTPSRRTLPAGRGEIPLLHKPGSAELRPLPNTPPRPPLPDSGLWTAVHLLCEGNSKLGKYDICTKCCRAAGVSSGHGPPLLGTQSLLAARSGHRGSGSAPLPAPGTRASMEEGKSRYSRRPCGCLTNRCGRGFSFPRAAVQPAHRRSGPLAGSSGMAGGRTGSHGKGRQWWPSCLLSTDLSITLGQIRTTEAYRTMISSNSAPAPVRKERVTLPHFCTEPLLSLTKLQMSLFPAWREFANEGLHSN